MSGNTPAPDAIDIQVGLTVRRRRNELKISQDQLGSAIGVTFQQIQKYERGVNRISASMLVRTAKALGCRPADLLPETDAEPLPKGVDLLVQTRGADEMLRLFAALPTQRHRSAILRLMQVVAAHPDHPVVGEDDEQP